MHPDQTQDTWYPAFSNIIWQLAKFLSSRARGGGYLCTRPRELSCRRDVFSIELLTQNAATKKMCVQQASQRRIGGRRQRRHIGARRSMPAVSATEVKRKLYGVRDRKRKQPKTP